MAEGREHNKGQQGHTAKGSKGTLQRAARAHCKGQQRQIAKGSKGTPVGLTPDVCGENWHSRQGYGMELVCQGDVVCCPHIGIAQLVKCEKADWPSCVEPPDV